MNSWRRPLYHVYLTFFNHFRLFHKVWYQEAVRIGLQINSFLNPVTTRTTSLTSVPHKSFALRFSDLAEIEKGCRESEEERAVRKIDWISSRISNRCAQWVEEMEKVDETESLRTPWWEELRRCVEGDHVPSRFEGWNHPVAGALVASARESAFAD
jgi:trafficking protein particle complex subunit 8